MMQLKSLLPRLILTLPFIMLPSAAFSQAYSNPYASIEGWAQLPNGRIQGAVGDLDVDPDGIHIWAVVRCDATAPNRFGNECVDSDLDSVLKFNSEGQVVESFGGGMFIWPHGIDIDADGSLVLGISDLTDLTVRIGNVAGANSAASATSSLC